MASEELYEFPQGTPGNAIGYCLPLDRKWLPVTISFAQQPVERIVDKRKNKKGKMEYLVRWRGYGYEGDTWEPEMHLSNCMEFIHEFNRLHSEQQKDGGLLRSTRNSPGHGPGNNARKQICRPHQTQQQPPLQLSLTGNPTTATNVILPVQKLRQQQPSPLAVRDADAKMDTEQLLSSQKYRRVSSVATGVAAAHTAGTGRRSVDLAKSGIKILVPKSPMKSRTDSEESPSEAAHSLEQTGQEPDSVPPEVALLEKPPGTLLGPGDERARMGTRPRTQSIFPPPQVPITPAAVRSLNGKGTSTFMEALPANGTASSQNAASGASSAASKRRFEERTAFDKRLRFSVRQTESAYRYRDIVVKKQDGFTHILLSTKSSENNSLNPDVMKEVQSAMSTAAADDSKLVLLSAVGSVFCFGLDFIYFIRRLTDDRKKESIKMAECIRTFVNTFIQFKKPIIVAVNGPAVGLGASILPLCDVVWANEKAWFQTPYTTFGQTPDACSSLTFPRVMGMASASEMLLSGRKLTAQEACSKGLVSQVFWPGTFTQEVMVRIRELVSCNSVVLCESKALVRNTSRVALEQANDQECEALKRVWGSPQGMDSILKYLQKKIDEF
ncbi:chromodomain Y-like protein isoform X2 [Scleropages formosus]|uniref:Chromodomain protein, Y-like n=1 Tax=Scleropages formosus TaxID=113540 RepID=A0A8C9T8J6_SCLFO|nr:chromodomain Y-like protein isoform X2 [Scleropages formosus]XP_029105422.1 chromodomain Y-like protein isoform X2 [Scleropages formosus]